VIFHRRDVWLVALGHNVGYEQDGVGSNFWRPVLILKRYNRNLFLGIPLTRQQKDNRHYLNYAINKKWHGAAIVFQIRVFDAKRLIRKIGKIPASLFKNILFKIKKTAALDEPPRMLG
jgi:mRNA interferase MazF